MRNFTCILLLLSIIGLASPECRATHNIGGEISFETIAPGYYKATYKGYYNLNNMITPRNTVAFNLRSPGCNTGVVFPGNRQSIVYQNINGGVSSSCAGNVPQMVAIVTYTANFALPLPHPQCSDWYLSVRECENAIGINIAPSQNACIYVEAQLTPHTGTFQKSSPRFLPPASLIFNFNTLASFSSHAININVDTRQDSIVYTLKPARNDHSVPLNYTANTSFSQPIPSSSGVSLHPNTGIMTFTPNVYSGSLFYDAYTVVIETAIYRRINGIPTKVSTSQRNLPVYIINGFNNVNPELINVTANGQPLQANQVFQAQSGSTINFQFSTFDSNTHDNLTLTLPDTQFSGFPVNVTSSATVTPNSRPTCSLILNTMASAHDQTFYFPVMVMDNACPARGVTTQVFGVKLLASPLGVNNLFQAETGFTAFPNPFSDQIRFRVDPQIKAENILIYNLTGQQIDAIPIPENLSGNHQISWQNRHKFSSGTYIAKLVSEGKTIQALKFTKLQ